MIQHISFIFALPHTLIILEGSLSFRCGALFSGWIEYSADSHSVSDLIEGMIVRWHTLCFAPSLSVRRVDRQKLSISVLLTDKFGNLDYGVVLNLYFAGRLSQTPPINDVAQADTAVSSVV